MMLASLDARHQLSHPIDGIRRRMGEVTQRLEGKHSVELGKMLCDCFARSRRAGLDVQFTEDICDVAHDRAVGDE